MCRGTYTRMVVDAYNLKNGKLEKLWRWDGDKETPQIRSQGSHTLLAADVDGDGRNEIILGSVALKPDGKVLWNLCFCHPDIMYMTDVIPTRPGLEIAFGYEVAMNKNGLCLVDARTGEIIWGHPYKTTHIHDQGMFGGLHRVGARYRILRGRAGRYGQMVLLGRDRRTHHRGKSGRPQSPRDLVG